MNKLVILVFLLTAVLSLTAETIVEAGSVQGLWNQAGSPYIINGNLSIDSGTTLEISSGVEVVFSGTFKISVAGRITSIGTAANPVSFTAQDTLNGWSGIRFQNTSGFGTLPSGFEHTNFSYGKAIWGTGGADPMNYGGAIWASNAGTLSFQNCSFYRCQSIQDGSAIYAKDYTSIVMDACVIKNCHSGFFGGVFVKEGNATITNTTFEANSATTFGAALYIYDCNVADVISCRFVNNSAGAVAGLYSFSSPLNVVNSLFAGNRTSMGMGGAIGAIYGTVTSNNCTFVDNSSALSGGAIWLNSIEANAQITNSLFWENEPNAIEITSSSYDIHYCSMQEQEGSETNIFGDPLLVDPASGDYRPSDASPLIDAGSPDTTGLMLPELDLAGNPRIVDASNLGYSIVDIGCYEWQLVPVMGLLAVTVIDSGTQAPILGATISINDQIYESDAEGSFSIELFAGSYSLACYAPGFYEYNTDIEISPGQTLSITISMITTVEVDSETSPMIHSTRAFPNPFVHSTEVTWKAEPTFKLEIYNARGQLVRSYTDLPTLNKHSINWDGRDLSGATLAAGIYFCRISFVSGKASTIKLILLK